MHVPRRRDANQEGYCSKEQQSAARSKQDIVDYLCVKGSHESYDSRCVMCHPQAQDNRTRDWSGVLNAKGISHYRYLTSF